MLRVRALCVRALCAHVVCVRALFVCALCMRALCNRKRTYSGADVVLVRVPPLVKVCKYVKFVN